MEILDMTGQPCPIPVVQAKKALAAPGVGAVEGLVDNVVAVQNLEKMANGLGYGFAMQQKGAALYGVVLQPGTGVPEQPALSPAGPVIERAPMTAGAGAGEGPTVLIPSDVMGRGSEELGRLLAKGFIFSLTELDPPPKAVIFLNSGAHLSCEGSAALRDLQVLLQKGVEILTCGTCLNYYRLTEKLAAGQVTDMLGITTRLAAATRLITL